MNTGIRIKNTRKEKNMTLQQLANIIGCTPQLISQYETGKRQPKKETIEKIAKALNVDPFSLYTFDMASDELSKDLPVFNAKFNEVKYRLPPGYTYDGDYEEDCLCLFYPDGDKVPCDIDKLLEIINKSSAYYIAELEKLRKK